jgi:hypothetical protein
MIPVILNRLLLMRGLPPLPEVDVVLVQPLSELLLSLGLLQLFDLIRLVCLHELPEALFLKHLDGVHHLRMLAGLDAETLSLQSRLEVFDECRDVLCLLIQGILLGEEGEDALDFLQEGSGLRELRVSLLDGPFKLPGRMPDSRVKL